MSNKLRHPSHLVDESPWPLMASLGALLSTSGMVSWFHSNSLSILWSGVFVIMVTMFQWWRDIYSEGTQQGLHSPMVELGLRWGMILFIVSEIFFFISFFWAFFHSSLAPDPEIGASWPPLGVKVFNPFQVPLLNTLILLSSGISVTWSHHALMAGNHSSSLFSLTLTILLGIYFSCLQALEYMEAPFSIADSIYGAIFFVATGFHGIHVLVGSSFLIVCALRLYNAHFSPLHHFGMEAAAWYWHFVDVVWLFLYIWVYWWGSA